MGCLPPVMADIVELKNGTRIEGLILADNDESIEIQVGQNETGTIRRVLIIHSSEISTWAADKEGRVIGEKDRSVTRLSGTDYVRRLLAEAEDKINQSKFDEGIEEFQEAADVATANLDQLEGKEKVEALEIRAHALRLALAGLEGKVKMIDQRTEGVQDELDDWQDKWEKNWSQLQDEIRDSKRDGGTRRVELGKAREQNDFVKREQDLRAEKANINKALRTMGPQLREFETLKVQTEAKIALVKERVDQAEDEAKNAEREYKRSN
jgi:hypothetical protein